MALIGIYFDNSLHSFTAKHFFKTFNIFFWSSQFCCDIWWGCQMAQRYIHQTGKGSLHPALWWFLWWQLAEDLYHRNTCTALSLTWVGIQAQNTCLHSAVPSRPDVLQSFSCTHSTCSSLVFLARQWWQSCRSSVYWRTWFLSCLEEVGIRVCGNVSTLVLSQKS